VATKEGGAITGEERIREYLGSVYGAVNSYEGRPTKAQADRAAVLSHELDDVVGDFTKLNAAKLSALNQSLTEKKLAAITVLDEGEWKKKAAAAAAGSPTPGADKFRLFFEND
jgi:hypothetical protein